MFSLKSGQRKGVAGSPSTGGIVLPRYLRKPARSLQRLFAGDYDPPRFANAFMVIGLFAATGIYGASVGGMAPEIMQGVTSRTGFAVSSVKVSGNVETSEIDVFEAIGLDGYTALVGLDVDAARKRIEALPWVKSVTVRKVYPDALEVRMEEKKAFAIWQHAQVLTLVEADGQPIVPFAGGSHSHLPLVVGDGAPQQAAAFVDRLAVFPEVARQARGYVRVAGRRWDVRLENGVTIRLPEHGEDEALAKVARLERERKLFSRDIIAVDLRLADRISVQLSPDTATKRAAEMKALISKKPKGQQT